MKIRRLDTTTINKIGAGEVIQRPYNVVKELIENSIDAGCSSLIISIGKGGLESIVVTDDGCGISCEDLKVLGGRYTTSKSIEGETFGYRGEALSCMTYVGKVTIISKTNLSEIGYKIVFQNGKIIEDAIPIATTKGTTVIVENLFDSMLRKKSMKESEEYKKIISLVSDYAIHNATISFTLRKAGTSLCEIKTDKNSTILQNIGKIYTPTVSKNLKQFSLLSDNPPFQMTAYLSNAMFQGKRNTTIFFVNNRFIEHQGLKKIIERIYEEQIPKVNYFVYLSIIVNKERIDCNVNPSKTAVRLLEEEKMLNEIDKFINNTIIDFSQTKAFSPSEIKTQPMTPIQQQKYMTRVDSNSTSLISFTNDDMKKVLQNTRSERHVTKVNLMDEEIGEKKEMKEVNSPFKINKKEFEPDFNVLKEQEENEKPPKLPQSLKEKKLSNKRKNEKDMIDIQVVKRRPNKFVGNGFKTLKKLRLEFEVENVYLDYIKILNESTFVGMIDTSYCVIQSNTSLYLIHIPTIIHDLVYQQTIYLFSTFNLIEIQPKLTLYQIIETNGLTKEESNKIIEELFKHASLLFEYFGVTITSNGELTTIPDILPGYLPTSSALCFFLISLSKINWDVELNCFQGIADCFGKYYSILPTDIDIIELNKLMEHILLPYIKTLLIPQRSLENRAITQIADTAKLYHVFERC